MFTKLATDPINDDTIKDFSDEAKTDIIKQFLEDKSFTNKNGTEQFKILENIKKHDAFKNIPAIKTLCEDKATTGKALDHILKQIKDKKYDVSLHNKIINRSPSLFL